MLMPIFSKAFYLIMLLKISNENSKLTIFSEIQMQKLCRREINFNYEEDFFTILV